MKVEIDSFSGFRIYPSKGRLFVRGDSKIFRFSTSKNESLFLQRKNPRKIAWTQVYRRMHKKGITEEVAKKRSRKTVKHQRGIVGADLATIQARRAQTAQVRLAQRTAAIQKAKAEKKAKEEKKEKTKPARAHVASGPKVSKAQMKGSKGGQHLTHGSTELRPRLVRVCSIFGPIGQIKSIDNAAYASLSLRHRFSRYFRLCLFVLHDCEELRRLGCNSSQSLRRRRLGSLSQPLTPAPKFYCVSARRLTRISGLATAYAFSASCTAHIRQPAMDSLIMTAQFRTYVLYSHNIVLEPQDHRSCAMVNFTILAGGYSSFVVSYLFNSDTSALSVLNQSPTGDNPSWITLHPTNKSILYATNENDSGGLQSFTIGPQGILSDPVDTIDTQGGAPAFCAPLAGGQVAVMNYNTGNGMIVPTTPDALHFSVSEAPLITFPAPVSHPHMALQHGDEVFVPDLGADRIWRLVENGSPGDWRIQGLIVQPTGSGPRHIATRGEPVGNMLYVLHELSSTLTQQIVPLPPNGTTPLIANMSILPPTYPSGSDFHAAEILLTEASPSFPKPYIYVSNRNTGNVDPRGDTIAIFEIEPKLKLVQQVYTGLDQIRGMQLGGPEKEFLIAAGVAGDAGTIMLKRVDGGANLQIIAQNTEIAQRSSFVWLD
ncbi:hypothetical protein NM688_g3325 [Phlebia brevispora]|uniref:Uncharacterized protein n=1 Tax=Phlebia brevispora TaxID=194682 RepID=A0ACC1T601_9APHY|nr:hypothetical protein NM688_g3325 [Phlebia brevispora]